MGTMLIISPLVCSVYIFPQNMESHLLLVWTSGFLVFEVLCAEWLHYGELNSSLCTKYGYFITVFRPPNYSSNYAPTPAPHHWGMRVVVEGHIAFLSGSCRRRSQH